MKYQLVCSDVDGTLIDSRGTIPRGNLEAIARLNRSSVHFALATGRMLRAARMMAAYYGFSPYIVCSNGAMTADCSGRRLRAVYLKRDLVREIYEAGKEFGCLMGYNSESGVIYNRRGHFEDSLYLKANELYGKQSREIIQVGYHTGYEAPDAEEEALKISLWADSQADYDALTAKLCSVENLCVTSAMKWNLEITAAGVSKWSGIEALMAELELRSEEIVCIGDSMNDAEMVKRAGLGVCMENGQAELKAAADFVTETNEKEGVARVIERCLAQGQLRR